MWVKPLIDYYTCIVLGGVCITIGFMAGAGLFYYRLKKEFPENKIQSQELRDFFRDIDVKGYGVVRIDPDSIYHRSARS